ncbi:MAG: CHC2 zinc finger domain-containing protein [Actinomycetota bacterium]|nr:CHC2 zinc finger domain-containing protein [Actinomycetota bacterium]
MKPSPIEAARARHSLAEVAARTGCDPYRTSGSVTVHCPLPSHGHPDRTPSLRLHLDDGIFSCFGCGAKGDVVEWVRQSEGVGWREAIAILDAGRPLRNAWASMAVSAGERAIPTSAGGAPGSVGATEAPDLTRTPSERVYAALEAAWGYYTCGPLHDRGLSYLAERGIEAAVLEGHTARAEVGHTPAKADGLVAALRSKGFSADELVDVGLAHRRLGGGPLSDFYRQRVLIPIRDDQRRIAGFIGRNVGDQERFAKYKNPPLTHAYDKSVNLYQPLPAPADRQGQVMVVEGTLDAMAIAVAAIRAGQAARFCPVTQSGRELSAVQFAHVLALHPAPPVLGFDGDAAGRDSAYRHSMAAAQRGSTVAVTILPGDHDPASWLVERGAGGLAAWDLAGALGPGRQDPKPIPAATYVANYLAGQEGVSGAERMEAIVAASRCSEQLPERQASLWASRIAAIAGRLAVAEAHDHVAQAQPAEALSAREPAFRNDWHSEAPQVGVGFEAAVGCYDVEALIERVAIWGRRLPAAGDRVFVRSAAIAIDQAGIGPTRHAAVRLEQVLGRVGRSFELPAVTATPVVTTDCGVAL